MEHSRYIHRCLALAGYARGHTGINPMVGAVLVREGKIIAEAAHEQFGGLHAEAILFKKCIHNIKQEDGLYINLEPCCHQGKKTRPCTEAIIKSGIKRVIIGMVDPNPKVAGKGIVELRKNGIEVISPVERARCEWFNRGFVSFMTKGRPWITLKRAQTRGGAIACDDGSRMKITSAEQGAWSHQFLRAKHDAILVGVGTVVSDDPMLTCRTIENVKLPAGRSLGEGWKIENYQPLRIVLDPDLRIPLMAQIVNGELAKGTMVIKKDLEDSDPSTPLRAGDSKDSNEKMRQLRDRGVRIMELSVDASGAFDLPALFRLLTTPTGDFYGVTSILVEGGRKTWEAFRKAKAVDCEVTLLGKE